MVYPKGKFHGPFSDGFIYDNFCSLGEVAMRAVILFFLLAQVCTGCATGVAASNNGGAVMESMHMKW